MQQKMIVDIVETDPICAMQACFDGFSVVSAYKNGLVTKDGSNINFELLSKYDLVVTATGNINVLDSYMLDALKSSCVVCNIGHFDNEIDVSYLKKYKWVEIKAGVQGYQPDGTYILLLGEGRLVNLALATGHPSRVMDGSFCNQVLAQIFLYHEKFADKSLMRKRHMLKSCQKLDEKVAGLMVMGLEASLPN